MSAHAISHRDTYRYLRLVIALPAAWLLLSMAVLAVVRGEVNDSISDYYGGPLRDVFVGTLMASGVCMIAYKGHTKLEDYALNFAGVNAFLVALVPNSFADLIDLVRHEEAEGIVVLVSSSELEGNLQIAIWTFFAAVAVFVLVDYRLFRWARFRLSDHPPGSKVMLVLCWASEILLLAVAVMMGVGYDELAGASIYTIVHFAAAALLVVNLSLAAASHAFPAALRTDGEQGAPDQGSTRVFQGFTALMWLGIMVGGGCIVADLEYAILITEVYAIVVFLVFWVYATTVEWSAHDQA